MALTVNRRNFAVLSVTDAVWTRENSDKALAGLGNQLAKENGPIGIDEG
jgi:hypothetical protein